MIPYTDMDQDAAAHRATAALAYVLLLFIIPMAKKESEFCQFHAKQGIVLFLLWIAVSFMAWIPFVGWVAWLSLLIVNILAIVKTLQGEKWELPLIAKYAKQIKL